MTEQTTPRKKEEITLDELDKLVTEILESKEQEAELEAQAKSLAEKRHGKERELSILCEILEVKNVSTPTGAFVITEKSGFKMPADDENREKLFAYMKEIGIYDAYITVNSQKLNSWANTQEEEEIKKGNFDFQIPGLTRSEPYFVYKTTRNKAKKK